MPSEFEERVREIIMDFKNGYLKYESTIKQIMKVVSEAEHEAYQEGYNDGYRQGEEEGYHDAMYEADEEYCRGYNDALDVLQRYVAYMSSIPYEYREEINVLIKRARDSI